MTDLEQALARVVELEAEVKRLNEHIKQGEEKNKLLQHRLDELTSRCTQKEEEKQSVVSQFEEAKRIIKDISESADAQKADLEGRLEQSEKDNAHWKGLYDEYNKTFNDLLSQKNNMERLFTDERTKNEELVTMVDRLTKIVLNLSEVIE